MTSFPPPNQGRLVSRFGTPQIIRNSSTDHGCGFRNSSGMPQWPSPRRRIVQKLATHFKAACVVVLILRTRLAVAKDRPFTQSTVAHPQQRADANLQ